MIRVLLVDDDPALFNVTKLALEKDGEVEVDLCGSAPEARSLIPNKVYQVIISDYDMPFENGISLLRSLREKGDYTPFILFTGKGNEQVAIEACNTGVDYYLPKSGSPQEVFGRMREFVIKAAQRKPPSRILEQCGVTHVQILENLPYPVFVLDAGLCIHYQNRSAHRFLSVMNADQPITFFPCLLSRESASRLTADLKHKIECNDDSEDDKFSTAIDFLDHRGDLCAESFIFIPIKDDNGETCGFIVSGRQ